jgi:hypothetical protein
VTAVTKMAFPVPEQARAFVVGKVFSYTCFEGTSGVGRIFPDGSVVGTIAPCLTLPFDGVN